MGGIPLWRARYGLSRFNTIRPSLQLALLLAACFAGPAAVDAQTVTLTRIDARPPGHPLDSGMEPDPLFSPTNNKCGATLFRIPQWVPDSEKTHPDAKYYLYWSAHTGEVISMAWSDSLTGVWRRFNHKDSPDRAWGTEADYSGAQTPREGVMNIPKKEETFLAEGFSLTDKSHYVDVIADDINKRVIMYFHVGNTRWKNGYQMVATSKYGLNFNPVSIGGEQGHGVRQVLISQWYARYFEVEGEARGQIVSRMFSFVNGGGLYAAPIFTSAGEAASHANADDEGGYWNPSWPGDPVPIDPDEPNKKPYWWEHYPSWSDVNPLTGTVKAPELVPAETKQIVRQHNHGPRHFGVYHSNELDRDKIFVFYTCRRDMPESIVYVILDLEGLTEEERLDPKNWKRVSDVERVLMKPQLVWEGVEKPFQASASGGANNGNQFRDPDVFEDIDGKIYVVYNGNAESGIGIGELTFGPEPAEASLRITSPYKGCTYLIGTQRYIGWRSTGAVEKVDIEYSSNGTDWVAIASGVDNKEHYLWEVPDTPTHNAHIRIKETDGDTMAQNGPFMIVQEKSLYINRPSPGMRVAAGSRFGMTWISVGDIPKVDLEYTLDGKNWIVLAEGLNNKKSYLVKVGNDYIGGWEVPDVNTDRARLRIRETGGNIVHESESFSIVKKTN